MSKYTTEVRYLCEHFAWIADNKDLPEEEQTPEESLNYSDVDEVIRKARPEIFSFDYPIFLQSHKEILETKILKHYYTREIGEEVYGLWKLRLDTKMNEIMPYYNKLFMSELKEFDPLTDADYYREGERYDESDSTRTDNLNARTTNTGEDTRTVQSEDGGSDTTASNTRDKYSEWNLYSDTPQGGVDGIEGAVTPGQPALSDNGYLTNATHILHDGNGSTASSTTTYGRTGETEDSIEYGKITNTANTGNTKLEGTQNGEYTEHIYGKMPGKSYPQLIKEYRDILLNIDMMIIKDLEPLFLNLW